MRVVGVAHRIVRWSIASRGAARRWNRREAVVLAVVTDTGATGLGEAAPLPGMSIDVVEDALRAADTLASRSLILLDTPVHALALADRLTTAPAARFMIETALLAAYAQHARTSIAALLATRVPHAELTSAIVVDEPVATGARCIKIKVDRGIEHVRAIAAANPRAQLRLDANRAWTREQTFERLRTLADLAIDFIEEPCRDAHELLSEPLPCRIALDESLIDLAPAALERALESPNLAA
ncbi:MAG TPA: enolase C-terminal domain-like protein, partial [Kofleriaceae bacterium]|nr:enolase C-terminal domain-like protein [Kofleriaceae bacterium]